MRPLRASARRKFQQSCDACKQRLKFVGNVVRASLGREAFDKICHNTYILFMPTELREEIKQTRPFASREEEAYLNIERTAAVLGHALAEALKPHGITATQYNVLRILRGAGAAGLCRGEVRERMIAQVPDVTRLLDRMEDAGLIGRARDGVDRRFVTTRITEEGLRILAELDRPLLDAHHRQLGHMGDEKLCELIGLLNLARNPG